MRGLCSCIWAEEPGLDEVLAGTDGRWHGEAPNICLAPVCTGSAVPTRHVGQELGGGRGGEGLDGEEGSGSAEGQGGGRTL